MSLDAIIDINIESTIVGNKFIIYILSKSHIMRYQNK